LLNSGGRPNVGSTRGTELPPDPLAIPVKPQRHSAILDLVRTERIPSQEVLRE